MGSVKRLPEGEREIMQHIWDETPPVERRTIERALGEKHLAPSTILTYLTRLTEKGFLSVEREGRSNAYTPLISRREYLAAESRDLLDKLYGGSLRSFAVSLCDGGVSREEIDELRRMLEEQVGAEEAKKRIYATTDKARGALKSLADAEGWETFVVPDEIGGRYSVLTAVGLLPIAVAGIDIEALMRGAAEMMDVCAKGSYACPAWKYAAIRYELYRSGRPIELLACYDPAFRFMSEWWKQLYGESEGKDGKGLFPASVDFTADLHSMGQYIQEGKRLMFETVVRLGASNSQVYVPKDETDGDGLNFLAGESMDYIRDRAMEGTLLAHTEGGVPNVIVEADGKTPEALGQLIYFFEYACGLSGYLLDVNPFDQPGVEAYKKNMFALLGKPGYEDRKAELEAKLKK